MPGTIIERLKLNKVVDGDTIKVEIDNEIESLRLNCLDTEESYSGSSKPVTPAGKLASKWAKEYFGVDEKGFPTGEVLVDIEFDTNDPVNICLEKHRGNYGRLICYVYKDGKNYNLDAVKNGWSPYFVKYGRSRLYHEEFIGAEAYAQSSNLAIWNPDTNSGGNQRDYAQLIPWWHLRQSVVEEYRQFGIQSGAKSVRLNHDEILDAAGQQNYLTVFCDIQGGLNSWTDNGALVYGGSPQHKFNLWIPEPDSTEAMAIINLIQKRYSGYGRGYLYVSGQASFWPPTSNDKPQIVLTDRKQLSDLPPG